MILKYVNNKKVFFVDNITDLCVRAPNENDVVHVIPEEDGREVKLVLDIERRNTVTGKLENSSYHIIDKAYLLNDQGVLVKTLLNSKTVIHY